MCENIRLNNRDLLYESIRALFSNATQIISELICSISSVGLGYCIPLV